MHRWLFIKPLDDIRRQLDAATELWQRGELSALECRRLGRELDERVRREEPFALAIAAWLDDQDSREEEEAA